MNDIKLVVGNDISWSQIEFLNNIYKEVLFTNHNASISMPFKENCFDVSYCSNTLHHMPNKDSVINMFENMFKISKKIIIVEIKNPTKTGGFPYLLNKYWYTLFLKDVGKHYFDINEFKNIINEVFSNKAIINFDSFKNIMGNYMIAEIIKK